MADSRTDKLIAARRQAARVKHDHTLQTLQRLARSEAAITFAGVAREAGVSTWLLYNSPELKQAVSRSYAASITIRAPIAGPPGTAAPQSLRTDLELARQEIAALRRSERKLRERLQRTLGAEIEQMLRVTDLADGRVVPVEDGSGVR